FVDRDALVGTLRQDLSAAAGADVEVLVQPFRGMQEILEVPDGSCLDSLDVACEDFEVKPTLLALRDAAGDFEQLVEEVVYTDLFRSLCPVTGQPDWATVLI